jgi:NADH-ubiquinone oxidoreductase chain 5
LNLGSQTTKILDKGSIEWVGPYGIYKIMIWISKTVSSLSKGVVTDYALYILLGICFYLSMFSFITTSFDSVSFIIISSITLLCLDYKVTS